jgi:hypothetical protein
VYGVIRTRRTGFLTVCGYCFSLRFKAIAANLLASAYDTDNVSVIVLPLPKSNFKTVKTI